MDSKGLIKISSRAEGASSSSSPKRMRKDESRRTGASPEVARLPYYVYPFAAHVRRRMGCTHVVDIGCDKGDQLAKLNPELQVVSG